MNLTRLTICSCVHTEQYCILYEQHYVMKVQGSRKSILSTSNYLNSCIIDKMKKKEKGGGGGTNLLVYIVLSVKKLC